MGKPDFFVRDKTRLCSCPLEDGMWGASGWHWRARTDGMVAEAYERCAPYWRKAGRTVDPSNPMKLMGPAYEESKSKRRIAG